MNTNKNKKTNRSLNEFFSGYGGILIVLLLFVLLFSVGTNTFFKKDNLILIVRQASTSCMMAFGMTFVLISGSINLGIGGVYGVSGILTAIVCIKKGMPVAAGVGVALLIGLVCGVVTGWIITNTDVPAFIATLGLSYILRGCAYLISGGKQITIMEDSFNRIGSASILSIPIPIYYMLALLIVLSLLLNRTKTGRYIYATGSNRVSAKFAGINTNKITYLVHILACILAALTGMVNAARLYSATPGMGEGSEIDAIAAVVIGGTSMAGGSGSLIGTLLGSTILAVMSNGLNHFGLNSYYQQVAKGVLLIVAVAIDGIKKRIEYNRIMKKAAEEAK